MRRMNKPSADNAFALSAATRRRTKVRRAARLVYSIKPYFIAYDDDFKRFLDGCFFPNQTTPCVIWLYAVCTFFTSPVTYIFRCAHKKICPFCTNRLRTLAFSLKIRYTLNIYMYFLCTNRARFKKGRYSFGIRKRNGANTEK